MGLKVGDWISLNKPLEERELGEIKPRYLKGIPYYQVTSIEVTNGDVYYIFGNNEYIVGADSITDVLKKQAKVDWDRAISAAQELLDKAITDVGLTNNLTKTIKEEPKIAEGPVISKGQFTYTVTNPSKELKTIYIAGPITGVDDFKANFKKVEDSLLYSGYKVMNPAVLGEGFPYQAYMPICLAMIDACETVMMMEGWTKSKGACLEHQYATLQGKNVIYEGGLW